MSTLITTTVQGVNTIKKDASTTNATLNANGTITPGNTAKTNNAWNSSFAIGVLDNTYAAFAQSLGASDATYIHTSINLINPRTVHIGWYFYKNSHTSMTATYGWAIQLPADILPIGGPQYCYQSIPAAYLAFNGTNHFNATPHRWQSNTNASSQPHRLLNLYGAQATTNWSSSTFESSGAGILTLSQDVTTAYA
tara:strand:+ start:496 stop:1080 length:585 start_codon:yes stop_codon:yes gene_type:complete